MPVRIRLQRHGKKGKPFYWIVAADSRSKRDGRYLEKLGIYNPNTNPATVELDIEGAVKWLQNGAQPSDTARTLLSYKGAMIKHHLNGGVRKGAFTQDEADKKFTAWLEQKQAKIQTKIDSLDKDKAKDLAMRLESEKAVNQKRISDLLAKPEVQENEGEGPESGEAETTEILNEEASAVDDNATEEASNETSTTEEVTEELVATEQPSEETIKEEPATETIEEEPAAETIEEEPATETIEEAPPAETIEKKPSTETIEEVPAAETIEEEPAADQATSTEKSTEEEENKK
jgi:small subunit ribosomal protein S16